MIFRGNHIWMFSMQLFSGIIAYPLMAKLGLVAGILISFVPFLLGMITTHWHYQADERDMQLVYKTDTFSSIFLVVAMAMIYLYFPGINWFFAFVAGISIFRGITGIFVFATQ